MKRELKADSMVGSSSKASSSSLYHNTNNTYSHLQAQQQPITLHNTTTPPRSGTNTAPFSSKLNSYLTPENEKYGRDNTNYSSILPISGSKVDLSEELASQIEYNNALLKELQTMERKVQDLNKELSLKDQDLRNSSQERFNLQNKIDQLQGEMYNAQFIVDRLEHENNTTRDQLENSKRKNQDLQNEIKESLDKLEVSTQQLSDRNSHTKDLEHELNLLKERCDKYEEEITNLHYQIDDYTNQLVNEKNQYIDLQKQYDQEREDFLNDIQRLTEDIDKLKRELSLSDKERDRIVFEKDLAEKKLFDMETQLESQSIQTNEKLRKNNEEYDHLMKQFKQLSQDYSSLKTIHYKYLGDVQNELRDICSSMVTVKDRYSNLSHQVRDAQNFSRSLLSIENSRTEATVNEMKTLIEERSRSIADLQTITDQSHTLEVKLEEEKSRSIMFEERASKFEQQLQDLQQKGKLTERELTLKHAQQVDKLNNEIESQKNSAKRLEDDISNLRKGQQVLQKSKSDVEEAERKTQKENRVLTESIRKLQRQLEETKRYLSIVQTDRNNVHNEKENLRKELHEILNSQRNNSNLVKSSSLSVPNLTFDRVNQPSSSLMNDSMNPLNTLTTPSIVLGNDEVFGRSSLSVSMEPTISFSSDTEMSGNASNTLGASSSASNGLLTVNASQTPRSRTKSQFMRLQPASPKQTLAEIIPRTSIARVDAPNNEAIVLYSPLQEEEEDEENLKESGHSIADEEDSDDEMVMTHLPRAELSTSFDQVLVDDHDDERLHHHHTNDYITDDDEEDEYNEDGGVDNSSPRN